MAMGGSAPTDGNGMSTSERWDERPVFLICKNDWVSSQNLPHLPCAASPITRCAALIKRS